MLDGVKVSVGGPGVHVGDGLSICGLKVATLSSVTACASVAVGVAVTVAFEAGVGLTCGTCASSQPAAARASRLATLKMRSWERILITIVSGVLPMKMFLARW